ncbi:MAG: type II secretion system F family protein [Aeromicrobium sp.]
MTGGVDLVASTLGAVAAWLALPAPAERRCRALCRDASARAAGRVTDGAARATRVSALLDLMAAALEAGLAPSGALSAVAAVLAPSEQERLQRAAAMLDVGGEASEVWHHLAQDPVLGPLATALERSERSGAPVAMVVRGLADELRRDDRARRLGAARRVGIRTAVPLGACFLPAFFLVAIVPTVVALLRDAF